MTEKITRKERKSIKNKSSPKYSTQMPITRKLARSIAHHNMKIKGMTRVNKKHGSRSYFSINWREWVHKIPKKRSA